MRNRIPDPIRDKLVHLALEQPDLSPRELAVRFTDTESYFVSEASVYRLLNAHDLVTSPAFIVMKAADEFKDKTTATCCGTSRGCAGVRPQLTLVITAARIVQSPMHAPEKKGSNAVKASAQHDGRSGRRGEVNQGLE